MANKTNEKNSYQYTYWHCCIDRDGGNWETSVRIFFSNDPNEFIREYQENLDTCKKILENRISENPEGILDAYVLDAEGKVLTKAILGGWKDKEV